MKRFAKLRSDAKYVTVCPCGRQKHHQLTLAKIDAAQFFKSASVKGGLKRIKKFLRRTELVQEKNGVAVLRSARAHGYLCSSDRKVSKDHDFCSFDEILTGVHYAASDRYFVLGDEIIERLDGWPMGGSFSEPATLIDLGHDVAKFHLSAAKQEQVGWILPGYSPTQLIAGLLHVDDSHIASRVFCLRCLLRGVPPDVGTSLEDSGASVQFLQAQIHVLSHGEFAVGPAAQNIDYARGSALHPEFSRLAPFSGTAHHTYKMLRMFLSGRFVTFNRLAAGVSRNAALATAATVCECLRLQWPLAWIIRVMRTVPRHYRSEYTACLRKVSKVMAAWQRASSFDDLLCLFNQ